MVYAKDLFELVLGDETIPIDVKQSEGNVGHSLLHIFFRHPPGFESINQTKLTIQQCSGRRPGVAQELACNLNSNLLLVLAIISYFMGTPSFTFNNYSEIFFDKFEPMVATLLLRIFPGHI